MNSLQGVVNCPEQGLGEILVEEPIRLQALGCITRMLAFTAALKAKQTGVRHRRGLKFERRKPSAN